MIGKKMGDQKMKNIDYDWLKRIDAIHDKLDRHVPLKSNTRRCTKEILIDRYFSFLNGKTFKLRIPITSGKYASPKDMEYETFYVLFNKTKHTIISSGEHNGEVYYSYGVQKHNGWNDQEFTISFMDEKLRHQSFKLHWNGLLKIKYEEIPNKEYWKVVKLFIDPSDPEPNPRNFNNCKHFDEAQGKYLCTSMKKRGKKCDGVECGFYDEK